MRYSPEKIKEALRPWEKNKETNITSIRSRLEEPANDTNIIIYKKYKLFEMLPFPYHHYITVNGLTWHPGNKDAVEIFNIYDANKHVIMKMAEMCDSCTYELLKSWFKSDQDFDFLTNNCQRITGYIFETSLVIGYFASLILFVITGYGYIFILSCIIMLLVMIHSFVTSKKKTFIYESCPHIRKI